MTPYETMILELTEQGFLSGGEPITKVERRSWFLKHLIPEGEEPLLPLWVEDERFVKNQRLPFEVD